MESMEKCSHASGKSASCRALLSVDFPVPELPEITIKLVVILL
jgi:hypothetical protein